MDKAGKPSQKPLNIRYALVSGSENRASRFRKAVASRPDNVSVGKIVSIRLIKQKYSPGQRASVQMKIGCDQNLTEERTMDRTSRMETMAIPMPHVRAVLCCWDFWRFCSFAALSARFWYLDFFSLIFYSLISRALGSVIPDPSSAGGMFRFGFVICRGFGRGITACCVVFSRLVR